MQGTVHVVGAGLAGLAAAERLSERGAAVVLHEAAPHAGGRCRSFPDATLGMVIDNGNHLLLSGNREALDYADRIGGSGALTTAGDCRFPFVDMKTGERWTLRPNAGRLPRWVFDPARRVPGSSATSYLAPLKLFLAGRSTRLGDRMDGSGLLYERLWRPLLLAGLNTEPREASARLAAALIRETLALGGDACRPVVAGGGLSAALVDPALATLRRRGADVRFGTPLREIPIEGGRAARLAFRDGEEALGPADRVVLAVPPWTAKALLPGISAPDRFSAIVNAHFRVATAHPSPLPLGMVNGLSEWLFAFPDRLSVTISAADRLMERPREDLAREIWREIAAVSGLGPELPPWQIVRERRATFLATPEQAALRPGAETPLSNLFLAGDWTATGLPATIEGAVRSGRHAAGLALKSRAARDERRAAA